jgi:hypothetical protein
MQTLEFDQFEFPYASSEEHLRLFIESRERTPDATRFLVTCLSSDERSGIPSDLRSVGYEESEWRGKIGSLLAHFTPKLATELPTSHVITLLLGFDEHQLLSEVKSTAGCVCFGSDAAGRRCCWISSLASCHAGPYGRARPKADNDYDYDYD